MKEKKPKVKIYLADPEGSVLYHRVKDKVAYAPQQAERKLERHRFDTVTEEFAVAPSPNVGPAQCLDSTLSGELSFSASGSVSFAITFDRETVVK